MSDELRLRISEDGADLERLARLSGYLRTELLELDVENVVVLKDGVAPPGTRGSEVAVVGGLLVALGQSAQGLRSVVSVVVDWLRRGDGTQRSVRLELDGNALEISHASKADQERLIELFISRHTGGKGQP